MNKIKMYLSARISKDAHKWNNHVCDLLSEHFEVFKPQEHNPYQLDHRQFEMQVYQTDLDEMIKSEIGILLTPYGRDCAWEVGWYSCSQKPIVLYVEDDLSWTRDWMIKGGVDMVITSDQNTYEQLKNDKIIHNKLYKIESESDLSNFIFQFLLKYQAKINAENETATS